MRKYNLFIILLFILLVFILNVNNVNATLPLIGKTIIIDAGHGGSDPGCVSNDTYEKDINLELTLLLEEELIKLGANVMLTRDGDYDLSSPNTTWRKKSDFDNRIDLINNSTADMYLSLHLNYLNDSSYYGPQVFYDKENYELANIIQQHLNDFTNTSREVKSIPEITYMYKNINISGVLIECGFMSNEEELSNLKNEEYQQQLVYTIAIAIVNYF